MPQRMRPRADRRARPPLPDADHLRLQTALRALPEGGEVRLLADDPLARIDVPHFASQNGHLLVSAKNEGADLAFVIRKVAARSRLETPRGERDDGRWRSMISIWSPKRATVEDRVHVPRQPDQHDHHRGDRAGVGGAGKWATTA